MNPTTFRILMLMCVAIAPVVHAQNTEATSNDIAPQALSGALSTFAKQTGLQLIYVSDIAEGQQSKGVPSGLSRGDALKKLLEGTELSFEFINEHTVRVFAAPTVRPVKSSMSGPRGWAERFKLAQAGQSEGDQTSQAGQQEDEQGSRKNTVQLEEVIVTAQKREERLIDVPLSVTILSPDALAKTGAVQFRDFADSVPGLSLTTVGAGFSQVSLRGVNMGLNLGPTVAFYLDEVPYGSSSALTWGYLLALDAAPFDMERIEVLKGPQGTLYGASSIGGIIKYVTRQPDASRFGVDAQTGISSTRGGGVSYNGAAAFNAPIVTDRLALRVSGFYSHDGGYIDNLARGQKNVNSSNIYGGRADLMFTPTERLSIRITGFLQDINRDGQANADYTFAGVPVDGTLDQRRPATETFEQRFRLVSGTVTYDLEWASLTSISGYQTARTKFVDDFSGLFVPLLALPAFGNRSYSAVGFLSDTNTDKFTQEVRLASEGSRPFEWLIGGFYNHETTDPFAGEGFAFDLAGQPVPDDITAYTSPERFYEYAAFGNLTWHLTDKFNVSGGLRYARNREYFTSANTGLFGNTSRPTTRSAEDVFTYLGNARYHFSDRANIYLRYATGYRPGGPNFAQVDPVTGFVTPLAFESDRLESYEIGFKGETEDGRFGIDMGTFYIDWSNIIVVARRGIISYRANATSPASVRGAELALAARPTNALTLTSGFAYTDAYISKADADLGAAKGERLPHVPRFTAAVNADYELPLASVSLQPTVGATVRYVSDRHGSFGSAAYRLPDYATVDLRAGVTVGAVNTQVYVRNLFDERGQLSSFTYFGGGVSRSAILQPRTVGVTLSAKF